MRTIIIMITGLSLIACNLSSPSAPIAIEATPTAISNEISDEELGNITFWQSFPINDITPTEDDIVIIEQIVLRRMESDTARTGMPIIDLERTLQVMFESNNIWTANDVRIESLSIRDGVARIELSGNISALAGVIASMIPSQMQFTVFEEASIDAMLMTLDGQNIANFGADHLTQLEAGDFIFTREAFTSELGLTP